METTTAGTPGACAEELPVHPYTGLRAIGATRRGPIWPILGGSQPTGEPQTGAGGDDGATGTETGTTTIEPSGGTGGQDPQPQDISALPDWAQRVIRDARAGEARQRTTARTVQQQAQEAAAERDRVLAALGYTRQGTPPQGQQGGDSGELAALRQRLDEREQRDAVISWTSGVETVVKGVTGIDGARLLDSRAFVDSLDSFTDEDPNDPTVRQRIADHVQAYVAQHTAFRTQQTGRAPARSGGDHPGGSGTAGPITEDDLARMTPAQIDKALREGRLKHLL